MRRRERCQKKRRPQCDAGYRDSRFVPSSERSPTSGAYLITGNQLVCYLKRRKRRKRSKSIHDRFCKKKEFQAGSGSLFDGTLPGGIEDGRSEKNF